MPVIKPISDLRNKSHEISKLAHRSGEPVFITKNGAGDLVVMSMAHYERLQKKMELLQKLSVAESQLASGDRGEPLEKSMSSIRAKLGLET